MINEELIKKAASIINPRKVKGGLIGDVGCALESEQGKVFLGVCVDVGSDAICAERNAIGSMITEGEYKIKKIVATWKDESGALYVIPPCGNCRQSMRDIEEENLNAEVILDKDKIVTLKDLLPYHDWWQKV